MLLREISARSDKKGANSESFHCDEHFDTKLLLFRPKNLVAKCVFLQSSLRVNTGAICAFGRSYIAWF